MLDKAKAMFILLFVHQLFHCIKEGNYHYFYECFKQRYQDATNEEGAWIMRQLYYIFLEIGLLPFRLLISLQSRLMHYGFFWKDVNLMDPNFCIQGLTLASIRYNYNKDIKSTNEVLYTSIH